MARSYKEIASERCGRVAPEVLADKETFEQAYDIAVQVMGLREKRGLTQALLAERCGMDQAELSRIERGATSPTARTLQRIGEALEADLRLVARAS